MRFVREVRENALPGRSRQTPSHKRKGDILSNRKLAVILCLAALVATSSVASAGLTAKQTLGKLIFFDPNLSEPRGQSCASCHAPGAGFTDPDGTLPVSFGVIEDRNGGRTAPTAAYAAFSPTFGFDGELWIGGQFWDGRAATLADQAKAPFLNPVEMNNASKAIVIRDVRSSCYAVLFRAIYGKKSLDNVEKAYNYMADAIAAYESSDEVNPFTSKYDYFLKGKATLTAKEARGLEVFAGETLGNCAACHPLETPEGLPGPLLTDFSYDNLGIPRNLEIPAYAANPTLQDLALHVTVAAYDPNGDENGKFKVPTLRNVAVTGPWGHNGFFKSLKDIVQFYNARDVVPGAFGEPEVPETVNTSELGNLGLADEDVEAVVYFLRTLTDGYVPR